MYRGRRLWNSRRQAALVGLPACLLVVAFLVVHYHIIQIVFGVQHGGVVSELERDICVKLVKAGRALPAEHEASRSTENFSSIQNIGKSSEGANSAGWRSFEPQSAQQTPGVLDRLPQWFPPSAVDNEVQYSNRRPQLTALKVSVSHMLPLNR